MTSIMLVIFLILHSKTSRHLLQFSGESFHLHEGEQMMTECSFFYVYLTFKQYFLGGNMPCLKYHQKKNSKYHKRLYTRCTADILTGRCSEEMNDIHDGCIPFKWASLRALVFCMLPHWHALPGHLWDWGHHYRSHLCFSCFDKSECLKRIYKNGFKSWGMWLNRPQKTLKQEATVIQ